MVDSRLHVPATHAVAAPAQEHRLLARRRDLRPHLQPVVQRGDRLLADGDDAFLRALACHADGPVCEVDVGEIEPDQLREPQTRRVEELQDRAVAQSQQLLAADREQARDLIGIERRGQAPRRPRRLNVHGRVRGELARLDEVREERADG